MAKAIDQPDETEPEGRLPADITPKEKVARQLREDIATRSLEFEKIDRQYRGVLVTTVISSLLTLVGTFGSVLLSTQPATATSDTVSVCVNAQNNVVRSLSNMKVTKWGDLEDQNKREVLMTTNPRKVDTQCGDEFTIARAILPD